MKSLKVTVGALHHGVETRQALLTVDDELGRRVLLAVDADGLVIDLRGVPEHQVADREPWYMESNRSRTAVFFQTNGRCSSGSASLPKSMSPRSWLSS